ncbi:hypothetical protein GCM10011514_03790 [Emticicia aquatilis]|uniref:Uncharacterized protein n=1 Tax=Emticicia aquatilis TaxID=1537369 RepID=A0A916YF83_9BACT|nr:hypothetical protein GCM10011514_03790 [Emticicia aquatilis]
MTMILYFSKPTPFKKLQYCKNSRKYATPTAVKAKFKSDKFRNVFSTKNRAITAKKSPKNGRIRVSSTQRAIPTSTKNSRRKAINGFNLNVNIRLFVGQVCNKFYEQKSVTICDGTSASSACQDGLEISFINNLKL